MTASMASTSSTMATTCSVPVWALSNQVGLPLTTACKRRGRTSPTSAVTHTESSDTTASCSTPAIWSLICWKP